MLRIEVPPNGFSGLTFNELEKYDIPSPPNGFTSEINNDVVISFEDEQEAIDYARSLDIYAHSIDHSSKEYSILNDIIKAINDDGFVQEYMQG